MGSELAIAFGILGICLVIHIAGILFIGEHLVRRRREIERKAGPMLVSVLLTTVFAVIVMLHLVEAALWAGFYHWQGLFRNFETALYFSLMSYSTVGNGDVLLPQDWRLLGTLEAISGVLLCGLSTAFLFTVLNALFRFRIHQLSRQQRKVGPIQASEGTAEDLAVGLTANR